uniref:Aldehyde dehydrogenase domain-containing protein n=1 Tax=Amphimedon queenslandica TaxID=400682 RepID=A0A1X7SGZ3_AMPQE
MAGLPKLENFIDGQFLPTGSYIKSYDPSTGEHYLNIPDSGAEEVQKAVEAARKAFI